MANYFTNRIIFYGEDKEALADLLDKISACVDEPAKNKVRTFLELAGLNSDDAEAYADRHDFFTYLDFAVQENPYGSYFEVQTESAWSANMEGFYKVLRKNYDGKINMVYQSEESGCGIFINSDTEGFFFIDRYRLDYCYGDSSVREYFSTWQETAEFLNAAFPKAKITPYTTLADAVNRIESLYHFDSRKQEYIYLDRFKCSEEEGGLAA